MTMTQNKATLKHTVTQEEVEQYAGMALMFQVGQVIDVHVPVPVDFTEDQQALRSASDDEESAVTPDGYVGTRPGTGRP